MDDASAPPFSNHTDCQVVKVPYQLFFALGAVAFGENLLVVLAVVRNKNLHSPMYMFICSLAAFNTISSLSKTWENLMLVLRDVGHLDSRDDHVLKVDDVMDTLLCMSLIGSICSFLAIAVDRYVTIFHALRYHNIVTTRRATAVLAGIWAACGGTGAFMVALFQAAYVKILFLVLIVASLLLILFLYGHMFLLARSHGRRIESLPGGAVPRRSLRGAVTLTILLGVFMVCCAPFFLHLILVTVCLDNAYCECYRSLFQLHLVLLMSHAVVDPAIYAFRSAELRHTFRKMLPCSDSRLCYTVKALFE
ncbi:adrenocorticotropic hormone receptor [Esox lucius]|uniref:Melanocyte-stimulating hormone receptor n=1 Tax=Esox lucius TaxID=8010 RepID=A0AAY5KS07_ESOLU|nr:adrenocorticotropic hormone receptor [Esox lucius]XP_010878675.1 adrenocorticotropic hormone receptor [Esox lucius]XP_034142856.1 adrenocorticotropic hormone receptor [Esox lucius]